MLAASLCFTISAVATKLLVPTVPPASILFYQYGAIAGVLLLCLPGLGMNRVLRAASPRLHLLRAATFALNCFLMILGLSYLPFATAALLAFVNPIFVTILAPILLGERIGWRRWTAVLFGLLGVVLISQPWSEQANWFLLLPLGSALCGALRDIITRRMTATETSESMLFYGAVAVVATSGFATGAALPSLDAGEFMLLMLVTGGQFCGLYFVIESVRNAEAAVVVPFKYSNLVWVILGDIVIWGTFPSPLVMFGAATITSSMIYLYMRERKNGVKSADMS